MACLAEEKAISRVKLPVDKKSLYRTTWYRHPGWVHHRQPPPQVPVDSLSSLLAILQAPIGINPNEYKILLFSAVQNCNKPLIEVLLDMYEYPGGHRETVGGQDLILEALYTAIRTRNYDIVSVLIDRGFKSGEISKVSRSAKGHPLDFPIEKSDKERVSLLLSVGATPDPINIRSCLIRHTKDNDLLNILLPDWTAEGKTIETIPMIQLIMRHGGLCALETLFDKWSSTTETTLCPEKSSSPVWYQDHRTKIEALLSRWVTPGLTLIENCLTRCKKNNTLLDILLPDWMTEGKAIETIPLIHLALQSGRFCTLEPLLDQFGSTSASMAHFYKLSAGIGLEQYRSLLCEAAALGKRSSLRILLDYYKHLVGPISACYITPHGPTSVPEDILIEALYDAVSRPTDGYVIVSMLVDAGINLGEVKRKNIPWWSEPADSRWPDQTSS